MLKELRKKVRKITKFTNIKDIKSELKSLDMSSGGIMGGEESLFIVITSFK